MSGGHSKVTWLLTWVMVITASAARVSVHSTPVSPALSLQCPSCDQIHCAVRRAKNLECGGGVTLGVCDCCPVCAKLDGEVCGGEWHYLGKCDRGLRCAPDERVPPHTAPAGRTRTPGPASNTLHPPPGRCVPDNRVGSAVVGEQKDQAAWSPVCRPKCTPEHCTRHPKAICSAVDNAEKIQICQGECQHTSCRACVFKLPAPQCTACQKDDFRCMKNFGQCVKSDYCTQRKYPCRKTHAAPNAKFQCRVPECDDGE